MAINSAPAANSVSTITIQNEAVTLAKEATGTANSLRGYNNSGAAAVVTIGDGLSLVGGVLSATATGGGLTPVNQTSSTATLTANSVNLINNGASLVTLTIPATTAVGDTYVIVGNSSGGWRVNVNTGQSLNLGSMATTTSTGYIASTNRFDSISIICTVANTAFATLPPQGNLTVA